MATPRLVFFQKMKTKNTLILLAVVLAVAAFIIFYERKLPNTEAAKRQSQNVVNFEHDKLDGIIIQNGRGASLVLQGPQVIVNLGALMVQ